MNVRKINGSVEEFDKQKVKDSVCKAYEAVGEECNDLILNSIVESLFLYENVKSVEIRRQVENALMSINKKVAKSYAEKYESAKDIRKKQDFIKEYISASNAATGSKFDSNANVSNKNIVTLGQELYKENNIKHSTNERKSILLEKIKNHLDEIDYQVQLKLSFLQYLTQKFQIIQNCLHIGIHHLQQVLQQFLNHFLLVLDD